MLCVVRDSLFVYCLLLLAAFPGCAVEFCVLVQERLAFGLIQLKMLPRFFHVGELKVVNRKLQLILQPDLAIFHRPAIWTDHPSDVVNAVHVLQERRDAFQPIGQLSRDGVEINSAALLEVSELRDLESVEHHLPADAPRAQRWRLPIIFLELEVMFAQVNANRGQRIEVQLLHILRRRLQDHLILHMLEQAVGVLAVTAVGRTPRRLYIADVVGLGTKHAQEGLRRHGSRTDLDIIGLLKDATVFRPESLQAKDQFLEGQRVLEGRQDFFLMRSIGGAEAPSNSYNDLDAGQRPALPFTASPASQRSPACGRCGAPESAPGTSAGPHTDSPSTARRQSSPPESKTSGLLKPASRPTTPMKPAVCAADTSNHRLVHDRTPGCRLAPSRRQDIRSTREEIPPAAPAKAENTSAASRLNPSATDAAPKSPTGRLHRWLPGPAATHPASPLHAPKPRLAGNPPLLTAATPECRRNQAAPTPAPRDRRSTSAPKSAVPVRHQNAASTSSPSGQCP